MLVTSHQSLPRSLSADSCSSDRKLHTDSILIPHKVLDAVDNPELRKLIGKPYETEDELFKIMKYECNRLYSFKNKWPVNEIKPESLAGAGLFYLQQEDRVQCPFCHVVLYNWTSADKPLREHMKKSPRCPFLTGADNVGNVPIVPRKPTHLLQKPELLKQFSLVSTNVEYKPKDPGMADIKRRLLTYSGWPYPFPDPTVLAECGLYYSGVGDVVTCFFCGGSLGNWEPNDDPWEEHTKFFPDCAFLSLAASRRNSNKSTHSKFKPVSSCGMESMKHKGNFSGNSHQAPDITTDIIHQALNIFPKPVVMDYVKRKEGSQFSLHELCEDILHLNKSQRSPWNEMKSSDEKVPNGIAKNDVESTSKANNGASASLDALLCTICMDGQRDVVFQPCGHLVSCLACSRKVADCPVCRRPITHVIKTYLS